MIFLFIIGNIKCDSSICAGKQNCKETLLYPDFYCIISSSETNKYFYVENQFNAGDKVCHTTDQCNDKVVVKTNECVLNCADLIEIGDFCFKSEEITNSDKYKDVPFTNKKVCEDYTYIKLIDGKEYHICIDDPSKIEGENQIIVNNKCPSLYYDIDEKICKDSCGNKTITISKGKEPEDEEFTYYECRNKCEYKEETIGDVIQKKSFEIYESIEEANSNKNKIYCGEKCPPKAPYYYSISGKISPKCIERCDNKHFYNDNNECSPYCNNNYIVEESKDFFKCTNEECNGNYPFKYQKACLKNCKVTQSDNTFKKITYSISSSDHTINICVDDCFSYDNKLYSDDESFSCVSKCSDTSNIYHYNHKCYKSCSMLNLLNNDNQKYYYIKTSLEPNSQTEENSNLNELECVTKCPNGYYLLSDEICIKYCPKSSENSYVDLKNKKCSTCKKGEGFILNTELTDTTSPKNIFCYESCPPNTYHKINDNICYDQTTEDKTCYFPVDNKEVCYPSCKDIPGDYKYEKNNLCYEEFNCGDKYYYQIEGHTKCIENDDDLLRECARQNLNYLEGKECKSSCDNYKIEPEKTIYSGVTKLGKCCSSPSCDTNYKYYSEDDKILHNSCSLKAIENFDSPKTSTKGTCVANCPDDFPYEKDNVCSSICNDYYYLAADKKKSCVSNCATINKFYFEGERECLDSCSKSIDGNLKHFYYSSPDNKCYFSCSLINKYSLDINLEHSHQKCLDICPDHHKYYFENDLKCLSDCNEGFHESDSRDKCVLQCKSDEVVIDGNICSSECNSKEPFSAYVYLEEKQVFINKCVANCKDGGYDFFYNSKCMKECPKEAPYHYQNGMECLENCPEGYFSDANICLTKCNDSPYFILDEENKFYKCVQNCDSSEYYISSTGECVKKCHVGENFIGKNKKCKNFCDENEDGKYYKKYSEEETTSEGMKYNIYLCVNTYGNNEYLVDGTNEIVTDSCPENKPYLSINGNICYKDCKNDALYPFSTQENDKKICSFECKGDEKYFDKEEKICLPNCDIYSNNIINEEDNSCVSECNLNSSFKFQTQKEENGNVYCSEECKLGSKQKYSEIDFICTDKCLPPYNYVDGNLCLDKCPPNKFAKKKEDNTGENENNGENENEENIEYECVNQCGENEYYYEKDRTCIANCGDDYVIENTNICTTDCSSVSKEIEYHFYEPLSGSSSGSETGATPSPSPQKTCVIKCPIDKQFLRENNHCDTKCNSEIFIYYIEEEKKCLDKCPSEMVIDEDLPTESDPSTETYGKICKASCPKEKFLDQKTKTCISNCTESTMRAYYYIPDVNICLDKCDDPLYMNGYECVSSCPNEGNIYLDTITRNCVSKCTEGKNYVIYEFTHGEKDTQKKCQDNCTEDYPYYIVNETLGINECVSLCPYYVLPNKEYPIPIKCYTEKCPDGYKYFVKYDNGTSQCFMSCPNDMKYYDSFNQCYKECPTESPYFKFSSNECFSECNNKIDYKTKECVMDCSNNQKWAKGEDEKIYCLDECNTEVGIFLSGKECVKSCDSEKYLVNDITDPSNKKCNCMNLYHLDESGNKLCFNSQIKECGELNSDAAEYKYRIYNGSEPTNECSKHCFGLLSPSEDKCYLNVENCEDIDIKNTTLIIGENKLKCDCKFRYYTDSSTKKKICLEDECSEQRYRFYIPDTKECVTNCEGDYKYIFDNNCFKGCPGGSTFTEGECKCSKYFYKIGENNYKCTETCTSEYPYLIEETKECVKKCEGTNYEIFYKNQCYSSCEDITGIKLSKIISVEERVKSIAPYTCQCENIWYYDSQGEIQCKESTDFQECLNNNFRFLIKDTNQCINSCPVDYPFIFSNECFKSCEDANYKYQYPIKVKEGSKECVCNNLWERKEDKIECLNDIVCKKLMVEETKECVENCPSDYPLEFNSKCFKECPEGTKEDITSGSACICNNIWYRQKNGNMFCLEGDECPPTHPYKQSSNNECQQQICDNFILNYTCYNECPKGTKYIEGDSEAETGTGTEIKPKICECDPELGYWHREGDYFPRMFCELKECPDNKKYYINDKRECLKSCEENGLFEYNNICYEGECPPPTVSENAKTNKYKCITKKYATATTLDETYKFLKEEIVDLYRSVPKTGIIYKNFSSTIQIYGITREDSDLKNTLMHSSMSYIDISACSKRVFQNNKMQEKDEIVVVKYDLENKQNISLVKPVEYEFINSRTGQLLDMSVCTKNDVVISYSLSNILNYVKKKVERRLEESLDDESIISQIKDQYEKGKLITSIYSIDSFNINSTLYQDLCFSLELDGKDLVLEDRVKFLFPYYSLCEENCTYSHIEFDTERIYCNCPLKKEFNLEREHKFVVNTYNNEEIASKQKGPTNIPVMTCMARLKEKISITKNGGFFYTLILLIFELALFLITIFYSYNLFLEKINKISDNDEEIERMFDIEEITINHQKNMKNRNSSNEVNIKTSERALDAPPKRRDITEINPKDIQLEEKIEKEKIDNDGTKTDDQKSNLDESTNESFAREYLLGIMDSIRNEQKLLRVKFEIAINKNDSDTFITLLAEIFDKIYFIKSIFLLGKYDMFTIYFSVYLLYHLLLLTFTTCFYDIQTIQKIWNKENFPDMQYNLGYGLLSCLIVWVIYKIFLCIISNEGPMKRYLRAKFNKENKNEKIVQKRFDELKCKVKTRMIIYFVLMFIIGIVCLLYITTFCAVYTGTKKYVFKTYGIALVEVLIIKIVYGIILGILRKVGLTKQNLTLYKIAYYFDKLIH